MPHRILQLLLCSASLGASSISVARAVDYEKEIRPIFEANCIDCHGAKKQKSDLRVDQRAILLRGGADGVPAIVPGDVGKSLLLHRVQSTDPDEVMPPKGDPLTDEEIALIEKWIAGGAEWPGQMGEVAKLETDHWSFLKVERPDLPEGPANPVDAFLDTKLAEAGLKPNRAADARSLIRRVSVVLTGLPPKPEQVEAFQDAYLRDADKAYASLIDGLLASPPLWRALGAALARCDPLGGVEWLRGKPLS